MADDEDILAEYRRLVSWLDTNAKLAATDPETRVKLERALELHDRLFVKPAPPKMPLLYMTDSELEAELERRRFDRPVPGGGARYATPQPQADTATWRLKNPDDADQLHWQDRRTGELIPPPYAGRTWRHHVWDMLVDAWNLCFRRKP